VVKTPNIDRLANDGQFGKNLSTFDALYRVPFIWYWKGHMGRERIYEQFEMIDAMPTFLELCGIPCPRTVQGISLAKPLLGSEFRGGAPWDGKEAVFFETPFVKTVRTKTYKLSYCWKAIRSWGQLYDLNADPGELKNLYGNPAYERIQSELMERLLKWWIETQQPQAHGGNYDETAPPWRWSSETK
jgi:arylsulfatase A-like enzyme